MIEHVCSQTCGAYSHLIETIRGLEKSKTPQIALSQRDKDGILTTTVEWIESEMYRLKFIEIGAITEVARVQGLKAKLAQGVRFTPELLEAELRQILADFMFRIQRLKFTYIPEPNDKYFEQEKLFGENVYNHFDSARLDIKDAGNCIAVGLYTAAVFHLMRVAEFGLRHIAEKLNVELVDKGNLHPIEYATGDKVIQGIQNKIKLIREKQSHGPEKKEELRFYSDAGENAMFIKNLWRNDASHTRKRYIEQETLGVFTRIKSFMESLAAANS